MTLREQGRFILPVGMRLCDIGTAEVPLAPFSGTLFLPCGYRQDWIKRLYWEEDGFVLVTKRLEAGSFQWPRNSAEARRLSYQQYP